jgi:hypothetical protein
MMFEMMFLWWVTDGSENKITMEIANHLYVRAFKRNNNLNHLREY